MKDYPGQLTLSYTAKASLAAGNFALVDRDSCCRLVRARTIPANRDALVSRQLRAERFHEQQPGETLAAGDCTVAFLRERRWFHEKNLAQVLLPLKNFFCFRARGLIEVGGRLAEFEKAGPRSVSVYRRGKERKE